jgi:hypothetical protein
MPGPERNPDRLPPEAWLIIAIIVGLAALAACFAVPELLK